MQDFYSGCRVCLVVRPKMKDIANCGETLKIISSIAGNDVKISTDRGSNKICIDCLDKAWDYNLFQSTLITNINNFNQFFNKMSLINNFEDSTLVDSNSTSKSTNNSIGLATDQDSKIAKISEDNAKKETPIFIFSNKESKRVHETSKSSGKRKSEHSSREKPNKKLKTSHGDSKKTQTVAGNRTKKTSESSKDVLISGKEERNDCKETTEQCDGTITETKASQQTLIQKTKKRDIVIKVMKLTQAQIDIINLELMRKKSSNLPKLSKKEAPKISKEKENKVEKPRNDQSQPTERQKVNKELKTSIDPTDEEEIESKRIKIANLPKIPRKIKREGIKKIHSQAFKRPDVNTKPNTNKLLKIEDNDLFKLPFPEPKKVSNDNLFCRSSSVMFTSTPLISQRRSSLSLQTKELNFTNSRDPRMKSPLSPITPNGSTEESAVTKIRDILGIKDNKYSTPEKAVITPSSPGKITARRKSIIINNSDCGSLVDLPLLKPGLNIGKDGAVSSSTIKVLTPDKLNEAYDNSTLKENAEDASKSNPDDFSHIFKNPGGNDASEKSTQPQELRKNLNICVITQNKFAVLKIKDAITGQFIDYSDLTEVEKTSITKGMKGNSYKKLMDATKNRPIHPNSKLIHDLIIKLQTN